MPVLRGARHAPLDLRSSGRALAPLASASARPQAASIFHHSGSRSTGMTVRSRRTRAEKQVSLVSDLHAPPGAVFARVFGTAPCGAPSELRGSCMSRKGEANAPPDLKSRACDLGHTLAACSRLRFKWRRQKPLGKTTEEWLQSPFFVSLRGRHRHGCAFGECGWSPDRPGGPF
jgi:hypothetical protein